MMDGRADEEEEDKQDAGQGEEDDKQDEEQEAEERFLGRRQETIWRKSRWCPVGVPIVSDWWSHAK